MGGADLRLASADEAYDKMDPLVDKLVETISASGARPSAPGASPVPSGNYKIGDKGPGGGTIFYARDGKYLECSGELGKIKWALAKTLAENYDGGGFYDWRLPTQEELNLIYVNLKLRNLGGFGDGWYWSSSQDNNNGYVWLHNFSKNEAKYYSDSLGDNAHAVRAVRAF
jgi:hypothetical protein